MKLLLQLFTFASLFFIFQQEAHALSIVNLANVPHQVSVRMSGNHTTIVDIPAGQTYYLSAFPEAKMTLLTANGSGSELVGREKDVFAIWPDGTFGPQMKRRFRSKDNN
ncbi:MAG: hypothetical protein U1E36_05670 [Rickettsiales bacterium]